MRSAGTRGRARRLRARLPEGRRRRLAARSHGRGPVPAVAAVTAVLGHMYPVWLRFRGGKGVATGAGAFLPWRRCAATAALVAFVLVLGAPATPRSRRSRAPSRWPSLAFLLGSRRRWPGPPRGRPCSSSGSIAANLKRLAEGTESRLGAKARERREARGAGRRVVGDRPRRPPRAAGHDVRLWLREAELRARHQRAPREPGATCPGWRCPRACAPPPIWRPPSRTRRRLRGHPLRVLPRALSAAAAPSRPPGASLVSATKGIEIETLRRMTEVAATEAPGHPLAVALRAVVRAGGGAGPAHDGGGGLRRPRGGRSGAARALEPELPRLFERRRGRAWSWRAR